MFGLDWLALKGVLASWKLWALLGLALCATTYHLIKVHDSYQKGKTDCQAEYAEQTNSALKNQNAQIVDNAKAALVLSTKVGKQIAQINSSIDKGVKEIYDEAVKADRPADCNLTDIELQLLRNATLDANTP